MSNNFNVREFLDITDMTDSEVDQCKFWCTANRLVRQSGVSNWKSCRIQVNDTWDLNTLDTWLQDYHDHKIMQYLRFGWPLNAKNTACNAEVPKNQAGARSNPNEVCSYLKKEREAGSVIGPFTRNPLGKEAQFSPLDAIPKRDSDKLRVI